MLEEPSEESPKCLNKSVDELFSNITPPMMDTSCIAELQDINNRTKSEIVILGQDHPTRKLEEVEKTGSKLSLVDLDKARSIAGRQAYWRFRRKMEPARIRSIINSFPKAQAVNQVEEHQDNTYAGEQPKY